MTQDYFWSPEWQKDEQEADEDIKAGRVRRFSNAEAFISNLKSTNFCIDEDGEIKE